MNNGLKILLLPVAFLYGIVTLIRNRLYDWHFLPEKKFDVHTVGVGNLAVGGAGKTPAALEVGRILLAAHEKRLPKSEVRRALRASRGRLPRS